MNQYKNISYSVTYSGLNRKRQVKIQELLDNLHETQLEMIDHAVECSDMQQAKDVIKWIMEKS